MDRTSCSTRCRTAEHIGFGKIARLADGQRIRRAAEESGADPFPVKLPQR
ncbi:hypothetical protein [Streptomyces sp. NPDC056387]